jgi:hypothetical protein
VNEIRDGWFLRIQAVREFAFRHGGNAGVFRESGIVSFNIENKTGDLNAGHGGR